MELVVSILLLAATVLCFMAEAFIFCVILGVSLLAAIVRAIVYAVRRGDERSAYKRMQQSQVIAPGQPIFIMTTWAGQYNPIHRLWEVDPMMTRYYTANNPQELEQMWNRMNRGRQAGIFGYDEYGIPIRYLNYRIEMQQPSQYWISL